MRNDDLGVAFEPRLNPTSFPFPEYHVAVTISRADQSTIGREPNLARIASNSMTRKSLLAVLAEVVCGVDENLIVEGLSGEPFF